MFRVRFLRMLVRLRRWRGRPDRAPHLARLRRAVPYAASVALNLLIVSVLAFGYRSYVAKGLPDAGFGENVVTVELFERLPAPEEAAEVEPEDTDEPEENAEIGIEALPEGVAIDEGAETEEVSGEAPPEEEKGQDTAAPERGVAIPQVALPDVDDAGEGRPDGIIGVDCYKIFAADREKALECAGREILSGWRAEIAELGEDWERFASELGTENRQIHYGPLRGSPRELEGFAGQHVINGVVVPKEVAERYAAEVERMRRRAREERFGRQASEMEKASRARQERSQNAATYDPLEPEISLGDGN